MGEAIHNRILVVDDEEVLAETLGRILEQAGYDVGVAFHGTAALQALQTQVWDAVVLDLHMPGVDGIAVLRNISQMNWRPIVLVYTGDVSARAAVDAVRAGADDVLDKPLDPRKLCDRLGKLLAARSSLPGE